MPRLPAAAVALSVLAAVPAHGQESAGVRSAPYVAVQGEAEIKSKPEVARLTVQVQTRAETLDAAVKAHGPRVRKAHDALSAPALKAARFSQGTFTAAIEPSPPRGPSGEGREREGPFLPAVATTRFNLEIEPVEDAAGVVDALAGTGVLEVRQVTYAVKDPKGEMRKARAAAMRDAEDQARTYAEAGGFRLVEIVAVQDGNARVASGGEMDMPRLAVAAAPQMRSLAPATIDTTASVSVTWRIAGHETVQGK